MQDTNNPAIGRSPRAASRRRFLDRIRMCYENLASVLRVGLCANPQANLVFVSHRYPQFPCMKPFFFFTIFLGFNQTAGIALAIFSMLRSKNSLLWQVSRQKGLSLSSQWKRTIWLTCSAV